MSAFYSPAWGTMPPTETDSPDFGDRIDAEYLAGKRHEFVYLAADLFTDAALAELPVRNAQMSWRINKPGDFAGDVIIADSPRAADFFAATVPSKTVLYVIRDGVPIWGGIIWKRDFNSDEKVLKIQADTWDSYMYHRISDQDWLFYRDLTNPEKLYEGVEQIEVFRMMWRFMASGTNSDIRVKLGEQTSPVKRGVNFQKARLETYGAQLEGFAKRLDGLEWMATVAQSADGRSIERRIEFAYPKFGRSWKSSRLIWEHPGPLTSYTWSSDADKAVTVAFVTGKGDGNLKTMTSRANMDRLAQMYPRIDQKYDHNSVFEKKILDSHAAKYLLAYDPPINQVTVDVHPHSPLDVSSYFIGDEVRLLINDDLFRFAQVEEGDMLARVDGVSLQPNDDGLEQVKPDLVIVSEALDIVDEEDQSADLVPEGWEGPAVDVPEVRPEQPEYGEDGAPVEPSETRVVAGGVRPWARGVESLLRCAEQGVDPWSGEPL